MHTSNNKTTRVYIKASQLRVLTLMVISHIIERNIDVFDQWVSTLLTIQGIAWLLYEHKSCSNFFWDIHLDENSSVKMQYILWPSLTGLGLL